jgi:hypothetical protein
MLVFEWRRKSVAFIRAYDALVTKKKGEDLCGLTPVFNSNGSLACDNLCFFTSTRLPLSSA